MTMRQQAWVGVMATIFALLVLALHQPAYSTVQTVAVGSTACTGDVTFAVIGDFGDGSAASADVAALVQSWSVDFVITTGDNNYPDGEAATIDQNIGQFYHEFIHPYVGSYGAGAETNRFFPSLGNHDWNTGSVKAHHDYFTLPGNERYYDFRRGPVHFFALDSDPQEPDGRSPDSVQGQWLQTALAQSTARWKIVYFHHPPYSSALHGSQMVMQWPFAEWGATAVFGGHDHTYERIHRDGILYVVNGLGGRSLYPFGLPVFGSTVRYNDDYGAMHVIASDTCLQIEFITRNGVLIDRFLLPTQDTFLPFVIKNGGG